MVRSSYIVPAVVVTGSSLLVGCGGHGYGYYGAACGSYGSYGSYGCYGGPYFGAAGPYHGPLTSTTFPQGTRMVAIIGRSGNGLMAGTDGSYYRLKLRSSTAGVDGVFTGYSGTASLASGAEIVTGTVVGTTTPSTLAATLTDPTHAEQSLDLQLEDTAGIGSSVAALAGRWQYRASDFALNLDVAADGGFVGSDANGCTYSGAFTTPDARYDAYSERLVRSCAGTTMTFDGLAAFEPGSGAGPPHLAVLADDGGGNLIVADLQ